MQGSCSSSTKLARISLSHTTFTWFLSQFCPLSLSSIISALKTPGFLMDFLCLLVEVCHGSHMEGGPNPNRLVSFMYLAINWFHKDINNYLIRHLVKR